MGFFWDEEAAHGNFSEKRNKLSDIKLKYSYLWLLRGRIIDFFDTICCEKDDEQAESVKIVCFQDEHYI